MLLALIAFILTLLLTPAVRRLAMAFDWVDRPDNRKRHRTPVPRIGGVPVIIAYAASFAIVLALDPQAIQGLQTALPMVWRLAPAVSIIFLVGLIDDLAGLNPIAKLIGQTGAAGFACAGGIQITGLAYQPIEPYIGVPLTIVWLLACMNAFNLIDGLDGLAAGVGLIATLTCLAAAILHGDTGLVIAMAPLAGSLLAFLRYNFNPASIFLGDSGSLSIGFILGCCAVIWSQKSATILGMTAPLIALSIPLLDMVLAVARRALSGRPIMMGDRGHIHHRLLDLGLSTRRAVLLLYMGAGVAACFSLLQSALADAVLLLTFLFLALVLLSVPALRYSEFGIAIRLVREKKFQRMVGFHNVLREYENAIRRAATVQDCWQAVLDLGNRLNFRDIELRFNGTTRQTHWAGVDSDFWTLDIPLGEYGFVKLSCNSVPGEPVEARILSAVLRQTLVSKSVQFANCGRQTALPSTAAAGAGTAA